jgi:hypothetical protein
MTNFISITMYSEYRFPQPEQAMKKQREIKKQYGYKPEVYLMRPSPNSNTYFSIVIPKGLVPINKKKDNLGNKVFDF